MSFLLRIAPRGEQGERKDVGLISLKSAVQIRFSETYLSIEMKVQDIHVHRLCACLSLSISSVLPTACGLPRKAGHGHMT